VLDDTIPGSVKLDTNAFMIEIDNRQSINKNPFPPFEVDVGINCLSVAAAVYDRSSRAPIFCEKSVVGPGIQFYDLGMFIISGDRPGLGLKYSLFRTSIRIFQVEIYLIPCARFQIKDAP